MRQVPRRVAPTCHLELSAGCHTDRMRYRLRADAVLAADSYPDAIRRIGEHFCAWAADMPSDDPATWTTGASLTAPQFEAGGVIHIVPAE